MKKRGKVTSILINLIELVIFIGLIFVIVYLVGSENGLQGRLKQKNASEKLDAAIKEFSNSDDNREIEEYIKEIDGLQKLNVDKEAGTIELTIDGQSFFVVVGGNNIENYDTGNGKIIDGIYVEEIEPEPEGEPVDLENLLKGQETEGSQEGENQESTNQEGQGQEGSNEGENQENNNQENPENQ